MARKRAARTDRNPLLKLDLPVWRSRFVLVVMLLCASVLVGRAFYLQRVNAAFLQAKGELRYERSIAIPANRGRITDRHGTVLASSTPAYSIWSIPVDTQAITPADMRTLAGLLGTTVDVLNDRLAAGKDFVYLKRMLDPETAEQIAALKLPGIHLEKGTRRQYPGGELVSHLLGFTDLEDHGQEGIELAYDRYLSGSPGSRRVIRDRRGQIVEDVESIKPPRNGEDVVLALNNHLQYLAHTSLQEAVTTHKAKAGSVVVLDVRTGEILAMANAPTFDPNNRAALTGPALRNRIFTDAFEPGSVMKPFTVGLALEQGNVQPETLIDTSPGWMKIGPARITDIHNRGTLTVKEVLQKSSNIGVVKMAMAFRPEEMASLYEQLGFGAPLKLGFPGETGGRIRPVATWKPIEQATMSYGHGMSVSLIQLARAYLVIARNGELIPLSLTKLDKQPSHGRRVFSEQTAKQLRAMLETVTETGGTATRAHVAHYRVAGKTGTALKIEGGQYTKKYISSFVGFAPVSDPRLIIAVVIDEPSEGGYYAGMVAAPVFAQIMENSLRKLGVPPDAEHAPLQIANEGTRRP